MYPSFLKFSDILNGMAEHVRYFACVANYHQDDDHITLNLDIMMY